MQQCRRPALHIQQVARRQLAAGDADVACQFHLAAGQVELSACLKPKAAVDADAISGRQVDPSPLLGTQLCDIQPHRATPLFVDRGQQRPRGLRPSLVIQAHIRAEHTAAALAVVAPQVQLRIARDRRLRLRITLQRGIRPAVLLRALEGSRLNLSIQHRGRCGDDQASCIAADRVSVIDTLRREYNRITEGLGDAPALLPYFMAAVQAIEEHLRRRVIKAVDLAIDAAHPALPDHAALHIQAATGKVDA